MVFGWFDAREAKAFGTSLAQYFADRIPLDAQMNEKKFTARTQEVLKGMASQAHSFKESHKVGIYQKAQLGNAFKWTLTDRGYNQAYVEKMTVWLMTVFK